MSSKQEEAQLLLKLYELRREEQLRQARAWFATEFNPESAEDIVNLLRSGHWESAQYRMVTSYWDMAASLVNHGAIDEVMFHDANTEHLAIFAKIEPFLAEVRSILGVPQYLAQLEKLMLRVPDIHEQLVKRRKLMKRWAEAHAQSKQVEQGTHSS